MKFFISCPLGFEEELWSEIKEIWPDLLGKDAKPHVEEFPEPEFHRGGIEIEASLLAGVQLQFFLKTANRVLLRVRSFRCRDFPKLYQEIQKIKWAQILSHGPKEYRVEAKTSRLNNEKRIEEVFKDAFKKIFKNNGSQTLYVRFENDLCTISIDLSGEHLHKRGWGEWKGPAPIRETIAAFALRRLTSGVSAGLLAESNFLDPFCGSGTLVLESQMLWRGPLRREFQIQDLVGLPKLFLTEKWHLNFKNVQPHLFAKAWGSDLAPEIIEAAKNNWSQLQKKYPLPMAEIRFFTQDFYQFAEPQELKGKPLFVLMNPPYGDRLSQDRKEFQTGLEAFVDRFPSLYRWAALAPKALQLGHCEGFQLLEKVDLSNGGLPIELTVWERLSL